MSWVMPGLNEGDEVLPGAASGPGTSDGPGVDTDPVLGPAADVAALGLPPTRSVSVPLPPPTLDEAGVDAAGADAAGGSTGG